MRKKRKIKIKLLFSPSLFVATTGQLGGFRGGQLGVSLLFLKFDTFASGLLEILDQPKVFSNLLRFERRFGNR